MCKEGGCGICECNEDDVPLFWKQQKTDLVESKLTKNFNMSWKDTHPEDMWIVQQPEEGKN